MSINVRAICVCIVMFIAFDVVALIMLVVLPPDWTIMIRSLPGVHATMRLSRLERVWPFACRNLGDGGPASRARFGDPAGIYINTLGEIFVADRDCRRVRKIDMGGRVSTIAGRGTCCYSEDGTKATRASLNYPDALCPDGLGNVLITDLLGNRIWKVTSDGEIYTFAGTGKPGYDGEGIAARESRIWYPASCALGQEGEVFFAEHKGNRIRKVDRSGIITTVAGTGVAGFSGDGGPAIKARLNGPYGVAVAPSGEIYIADSMNHRIRHVNPAGIITTIVGTGEKGYSGDNVRPRDALLDTPQGLFVTRTGDLLIGDEHNHVIKILHEGILRNIAGIGRPGYVGDGGPATKAVLNDPEGVWVTSDGNIFFADGDNRVVRQINPGGVISTIAGVYSPR